MPNIETLKEYLRMPPDAGDEIAQLCLDAAVGHATDAGVPQFKNNKKYDLFIYALAGCWFDNRSLAFAGTYSQAAEENARKLINSFVLELRYAKDGDAEPAGGSDG